MRNAGIAAAAVLLLAAGIRQQREIRHLRERHATLLKAAQARGLNPDASTASAKKPDPRRDFSAEARRLVDDLIERQRSGRSGHSTDWSAQADLIDRLDALHADQLAEIAGLLLERYDLPQAFRAGLIIRMLDRLAEDRPQEALKLLAKVEPRDPEDPQRHDFLLLRKRIASCLAMQAPEVVWQWMLEARESWDEYAARLIRSAVLGGIARRDPAEALRRAEEIGEEGIGFMIGHCQTIEEQVAALKALRSWSGEDATRRAQLAKFVQALAFASSSFDAARFDTVIERIGQAGLAPGEIEFLTNAPDFDLGSRIDLRDVGAWMGWLDQTFPPEKSQRQIKRLLESDRTKQAAREWLASLPSERAAAFEARWNGE